MENLNRSKGVFGWRPGQSQALFFIVTAARKAPLGMNNDSVTYRGVTYHIARDLPPMKSHVETCSRCLGTGQMYGRKCTECGGRGVLFSSLSDERGGTTSDAKS
jgi:hypothetical protein